LRSHSRLPPGYDRGMDENDSQRARIDKYWRRALPFAMLGLAICQLLGWIEAGFMFAAIYLIIFLDIVRMGIRWLNRRDHSRTAKRPPDAP